MRSFTLHGEMATARISCLRFINVLANPYFAVNLTVLTALTANFLSARRLVRFVAPLKHRSVSRATVAAGEQRSKQGAAHSGKQAISFFH